MENLFDCVCCAHGAYAPSQYLCSRVPSTAPRLSPKPILLSLSLFKFELAPIYNCNKHTQIYEKNSYRFLIDWRIDLNVDWSALKSKDEQKISIQCCVLNNSLNDSIFFSLHKLMKLRWQISILCVEFFCLCVVNVAAILIKIVSLAREHKLFNSCILPLFMLRWRFEFFFSTSCLSATVIN